MSGETNYFNQKLLPPLTTCKIYTPSVPVVQPPCSYPQVQNWGETTSDPNATNKKTNEVTEPVPKIDLIKM